MFDLGEHAAYRRVALLGTAHGLDHNAEERRMQVAEEADETSVRTPGQQYMRGGRLGAPFGFDWISVVVASLKIAAVEMKVICILACQYGGGLRAGGNQHEPRRQRHGDRFG